MEFNNNRPIYLQIIDTVYERILSGALQSEERIMSVRELGAELGVNPNTVMRSYEKLTADGIIYNKRGIGYFIAAEARDIVLRKQREAFLAEEWPMILKKIKLLGIEPSELSL